MECSQLCEEGSARRVHSQIHPAACGSKSRKHQDRGNQVLLPSQGDTLQSLFLLATLTGKTGRNRVANRRRPETPPPFDRLFEGGPRASLASVSNAESSVDTWSAVLTSFSLECPMVLQTRNMLHVCMSSRQASLWTRALDYSSLPRIFEACTVPRCRGGASTAWT